MARAEGVVGFIRGAAGGACDVPDAELVRRFVATGDGEAFRALAARYGPVLWGVCRKLTRDHHAAEDAFQATLLALARGAPRLRAGTAVGGWLYAVAHRVAWRGRSGARAEGDAPEPADAAPPALDALTLREAEAALRDELAALPDKYRAPLVLCALEGLSRDEAAARLGWPANRVKHFLERGRERLRAKLERRGIALGVPLLLASLAPGASAAPPGALEAAVGFATGTAPPPHLLSLALEGTRSMWIAKLKWAAVGTACALAAGAALARVPRAEPPVLPAPVFAVRPEPPAPKADVPPMFPGDVAMAYLSALANEMPEKALKYGDNLKHAIKELQAAGTLPVEQSAVFVNDLRALAVSKRAKLKRRPNADPTDEHVLVELERKDTKSPWRVRGNDVANEKKVLREIDDYLDGKFAAPLPPGAKPPAPAFAIDTPKANLPRHPRHTAAEFVTLAVDGKAADAVKLCEPGTISEKKLREITESCDVRAPIALFTNDRRAEVAFAALPREENAGGKPMFFVLMLTREPGAAWLVKDIDFRDAKSLEPRLQLYLSGKFDPVPDAKK